MNKKTQKIWMPDPKASEIKKYLMWCKINELKREGHSISRIKKLTGYDRKIILKYLRMCEEEFLAQGCCVRHYSSRLDKYRDFIVSRLEAYCGEWDSEEERCEWSEVRLWLRLQIHAPYQLQKESCLFSMLSRAISFCVKTFAAYFFTHNVIEK